MTTAARRANLLRVRARATPENGRPVGHDGKSPVPLPGEVHTEEEWSAYFEAIGQGIGPDLAARSIGSTGTRIRRLVNRDPEYQRRYVEAGGEADDHYRDRLRATARLEALGAEGRPPNPRILEVELATHVPGYEHLRRDRMKHEGRIEHALVLDARVLDELPLDELEKVRDALSLLAQHEVIDQQPARRELTA